MRMRLMSGGRTVMSIITVRMVGCLPEGLANESIWAGRGRTHGRCTVWTADGRLVATYTQDNLVRRFGDGKDHTGDYQRIM